MTPDDPSLALPPPVPLAEPLGSLAHELATSVAGGEDEPFTVAGRQARITGGTARGADEVRVGPVSIATAPRMADAVCDDATITPLGLERRLRVGDAAVVERSVTPRDGPLALFEWAAPGEALTVDVEWTTDLATAAAAARADTPAPDAPAPGRLRWRRSGGMLAVAGEAGDRAVFLVGGQQAHMIVEDVPGDVSRVRVRARLHIPAAGSVRIAMAGGAGEGGETVAARAIRSARYAGAMVQARRGMADRLRLDRLALETPDPTLDRGVEWAKIRLADRDPALFRGAAECLLVGEFESALDTLRRLGERTGAGSTDAEATRYLRLAGEYLAWTGDVPSLQTEWPRLLAAWHFLGETGAAPLPRSVGQGLVHVAEAVGDAVAAAEVRVAAAGRTAGDGIGMAGTAADTGAATGADTGAAAGAADLVALDDEALERARVLLGVEPDATRGRLVLRPRPPAGWARFQVASLAMGDAAVTLHYHRDGGTHRFVLRQSHGFAPIRCILEPELPGRLRAARVDGTEARLEPVTLGERSRVPVQLALDHERTLELEMVE